jgi:hypothetical protein
LEDDHNRAALEFFSATNKGKIIFADSPYAIKRKMLKLFNSISFPIAKNVISKAVCKNKDIKIEFFHTNHLPNIYMNEPLVILGKINKLEDFTLFLQGIHADNWFNIKKNISFKNAVEDIRPLLQEWAVFQSHKCYKKYLSDGSDKHIKKAQELLDPFDIDAAFKKGP